MSTYQPGQSVSPLYRIVMPLSRGAMGAVYHAVQVESGIDVALKVIREQYASRDDLRQRFQREAQAIVALQHPNIVKYYDHGEDHDGRPFLVTELIEGYSGTDLVMLPEPLPVAGVVHVIDQLCGALAVAHDHGIVHRDLKWSNVIVTPTDEDPLFVKLIDFGILKYSTEEANPDGRKLTRAGVLLGTPDYTSPEQILGHPLDGRSDLYSVSVMTYELLTRNRPFTARSKADLLMCHMTAEPPPMAQMEPPFPIPPVVEEAVLRGLAKRPDDRFPSIRHFAAALVAGLEGTDAGPAASEPGGGLLRGFFRKLSGRS